MTLNFYALYCSKAKTLWLLSSYKKEGKTLNPRALGLLKRDVTSSDELGLDRGCDPNCNINYNLITGSIIFEAGHQLISY